MMNRRLLYSAIALVFAGSLAACGSDSSSKSTSAPTTVAAAAAPTTAAAVATDAPTTIAAPAATDAPTTAAASSGGGYDYPVTTDAPTTIAAPATTAAPAAPAAAALGLATDPKFGPIVVDAEGFSLYMFTKDTGTTSACSGGCAKAWPAAVATAVPTVGDGLDATLVGVAAQADGTMQLTYAGHLLYRFSGDTAAGQVNGQDTGEVWYLVDASGAKVGDS